MATVLDRAKYHNEYFWYSFIAVPEVVVVALCTTPGLYQQHGILSDDKELLFMSFLPPNFVESYIS